MKTKQLASILQVGDKIFWQASGVAETVVPLTVVSVGEDCLACRNDILVRTVMMSHRTLDNTYWTFQPDSPVRVIEGSPPPPPPPKRWWQIL